MPEQPKSTTDVAHFHGPWSSGEVRAVSAVLAALEAQLGKPEMPYPWMPPWVVVATDEPPASRVYLARRCGEPDGLYAHSIDELIDRLRALLEKA